MWSRRRTLLACFLTAIACRSGWAEQPKQEPAADNETHKFLRITRDDQDEPIAMETAIVSYRPTAAADKDLQVDLIGAVHIGEKSYYEQLNGEFEKYDVVLYELVAPKGTRVPKGGRASAHPISMMQSGMKNMLQLESQMELIDYQKPNLIHADMSPEDFSKSMEDRGDNFFALFFRMLGRSIAQQSKQQVLAQDGKLPRRTSDADMLLSLFDPNRSHRLKEMMAEQFEDMEGMMNVFDGPDGSTIITERNKTALAGLTEQIAAGKKRIAIFYGAGHMPDMEKRLLEDFHLARSGEKWLAAWHLTPSTDSKSKEKKSATPPDDKLEPSTK